MFVKDEETEDTLVDSTALAGNDEQTAEQTELESDETLDANANGLSEGSGEDGESGDNATTFSRIYVEKLRRENASYRERANRADDLAQRLHNALVQATGRLADPTDLPFDATHLDDESALELAIDELLAKKPHLASRRPFGDVGQGNRGKSAAASVNLAEMLRARA